MHRELEISDMKRVFSQSGMKPGQWRSILNLQGKVDIHLNLWIRE